MKTIKQKLTQATRGLASKTIQTISGLKPESLRTLQIVAAVMLVLHVMNALVPTGHFIIFGFFTFFTGMACLGIRFVHRRYWEEVKNLQARTRRVHQERGKHVQRSKLVTSLMKKTEPKKLGFFSTLKQQFTR